MSARVEITTTFHGYSPNKHDANNAFAAFA